MVVAVRYMCSYSACVKKCSIILFEDPEEDENLPPFLCPYTNIPKQWVATSSYDYRFVGEDEVFKEGDEFYLPHKEWEKIPDKWIGLSARHDKSTTFGRYNIPVRRNVANDYPKQKDGD